MDRICCIIDMEGFRIRDTFFTRELGWINMSTDRAVSIRFNLLPHSWMITPQDQQGIDYTTNYVHGLRFEPIPGEDTYDHNDLKSKVLQIYNTCKNYGRDIVAYKGGREEELLLASLGIPSVNLESFRCPKYDDLRHTRFDCPRTCGYHVRDLHCPMAEVATFRNWVIAQRR